MGEVRIDDHGGGEVAVYLYGDVDDSMAEALQAAVDEVAVLQRVDGGLHTVVDMHGVTTLGPAGIQFLRDIEARGERTGFVVSFANLSAAAHRAVENAGWSSVEGSPPENRHRLD